MPDEPKGEMPNQPTPEGGNQPEATQSQDTLAELEKVKAALKAANKEAADRRKRLEELEAQEAKRKESEMSEMDKLAKRLAETEAKLKAKERAELQRDVAAKVGIPAQLAARLQGETPDELEADAKELLKAIPAQSEPSKTPKLSPTNPAGAQKGGESTSQKLARIHGSEIDLFDPDVMRKMGGGVIQSSKHSG